MRKPRTNQLIRVMTAAKTVRKASRAWRFLSGCLDSDRNTNAAKNILALRHERLAEEPPPTRIFDLMEGGCKKKR